MMHFSFKASAAAVCLILSGCAKAVSEIPAEAIPSDNLIGLTCQQLDKEKDTTETLLATSSRLQEQHRTQDTVGVALIGLPVGSLLDKDATSDVSHAKGQLAAIEKARYLKRCI